MARRDAGTPDLFAYAAHRAADAAARRRSEGEARRVKLLQRARKLADTPVGADPRPQNPKLHLAPITQEAWVGWVTARGLASVRRSTDRKLRFVVSAKVGDDVVGVAAAVEAPDARADGPAVEIVALVDPLAFGQTVADALRAGGLGAAAAAANVVPATTLLVDAMARACRAAGYEWLVVSVPVSDPVVDEVLYPQAGYAAVPWGERGWRMHGRADVTVDLETEAMLDDLDDEDGGGGVTDELPPEQRLRARAPSPYRAARMPPRPVSPWLRTGHGKAAEERVDIIRGWRTADMTYRVIGYEEARDAEEERLGRELSDLEHASLMERYGYEGDLGYNLPTEVYADDTDIDVGEETYRQVVFMAAAPINPVEAPMAAGDKNVATSLLACRQIDVDEANVALNRWHSHLPRALKGHLFSLAVYATPSRFNDPVLLGVLVASYPKSRHTAAQRPTCEVNRVAVGRAAPEAWKDHPEWFGLWDPKRGKAHAVAEASFLLGRARQVAEALGYDRLTSHVLLGEPGTAYIALDWRPVAIGRGGEHDREARPREAAEQPGVKVRLEVGAGAARPPKEHADAVRAVMREGAELVREKFMEPGGEAPKAEAGQATAANGRDAHARALFEERRALFADAYPGSLAARARLVIVDAPCPNGGDRCAPRDLAQAHVAGPRVGDVRVARRLLAMPDATLAGIFDHELGHLSDGRIEAPGAERRADRLAARATGDTIYYDERDVQSVDPHAPGARARRPAHLHQ